MLSRKQDSQCQNWGFSVNQQGATFVHIFLTPNMRRASLTDVYLTSGRYICFFWVFYFLYLFFLPLKHTAEQNSFVVYLLVPSILAFPTCLVKSWWFHHVPRCWRTLGTNVNPAWEPPKKKVQICSTTTVPVWWRFKNFQSCKFISRAVLKHSEKQWVLSKAINVPIKDINGEAWRIHLSLHHSTTY